MQDRSIFVQHQCKPNVPELGRTLGELKSHSRIGWFSGASETVWGAEDCTSGTRGTTGPAPWLSSLQGQGPLLCAVLAAHLSQQHPRATASTPWPGGSAGGPWHAGQKRPVQQHCKPWTLERTRTYRPWTEGLDYSSRRWRFAGRAA